MRLLPPAVLLAVPAILALACGGGGGPAPSSSGGSTPSPSDPAAPSDPGAPTSPSPSDPAPVDPGTSTPTPPPGPAGWAVAAVERFDGALPGATLAASRTPDDGAFGDLGVFFQRRGVTAAPAAFRATVPFSAGGWLTLESYTLRSGAPLSRFADVVADPADPTNRVLRIRSPEHTDATIVRPSVALPARYRISLRVGFASFGDGKPGNNGYTGGEMAGPWWPDDAATAQNGFYWLSILDHLPRPHNNTWIHHHRKVVVDADNHFPAWLELWTGQDFIWNAEHPVTMIALDGSRPGNEKSGPPFFTWSAGKWQPSGAIRAVDAYLPSTWYRVTVERDGPRYTLTVSGKFRYGGERTYTAAIDAAAACVFHYPATAAEAAGAKRCEDLGTFDSIAPHAAGEAPNARWPADGVWPDWFVFGDPHENYYEGEVYYDDVVLETWRG
jgi:hypothetical protein